MTTRIAREISDPLVEPATTRHGTARLESIDLLRGLVIALMVLDHVREYFSADALIFSPTDLTRTTPLLFATRWVTHLCAPTFVFLAGVSAFLQRTNGRSRREVAGFLFTRGLWLIVLELTVVSFGFDFGAPYFFFQVIWAIGLGMVLLAPLLWLPPAAVLALGAVIVLGHDAFASVQATDFGAWALGWRLFMAPGPATPLPGIVAYPALPWFGILCAGYGLGAVFVRPDAERRPRVAALAVAALALFAVLRTLHSYGDPAPWSVQSSAIFTVLALLNVSKYPPSLQYTLLTLGVSLLVSLPLERVQGFVRRMLLAFGRTPMLTYLVHIYVVHGLALLVGLAMGLPAAAFANFLASTDRLKAVHWGFGLPVVYGVWLLVLVVLYPMSRAYAALRRRRRAWWMSYI